MTDIFKPILICVLWPDNVTDNTIKLFPLFSFLSIRYDITSTSRPTDCTIAIVLCRIGVYPDNIMLSLIVVLYVPR